MSPALLPPRKTTRLSDSVHRNLSMYALAAGAAGVGMLALTPVAEARVVYTPAHERLPYFFAPLDLNHDGAADFSFFRYTFSIFQYLGIRPPTGNGVVGRPAYHSASALKAGVSVGPKDAFVEASSVHMAEQQSSGGGLYFRYQWADHGNGVNSRYLGLKFLIKGEVHYGWARLNVSVGSGGVTGTLTGYAYETIPNKPIVTGETRETDVIEAVEPASLGRLAQGSTGVAARR